MSLCLCGAFLFSPTGRAAEPAAKKINYQDDILPIFRNTCLNCHNPDKKKSGLDLSTYQGTMTGSDDGVVIKPGDISASKLFKNIAHAEEPYMPQKADKLPDKDIQIFKNWIVSGAPETSGSKVAVAAKPSVDLSVVTTVGRPVGPPPMPLGTWQLDSLVRTQRPGALLALAGSPWAPLVAIGSQHQILLYNSDTLDLLGMLPFPEGQPNIIRFSRNGKLLICGGGQAAKSGKVVAWDVASGKRMTEVGDEFDAVLATDISPDQKMIVLGGPSKVLKAFNTADGKLAWSLKKHTDWVTAVAVAPDGVLCASGDRAGNLYVWEARTGRDFYTLSGHKDAITELVFRDDANVLASASADGSIKLWNMYDGTQINSISAHGSGVTSIAYGHDGRLTSTGRDNLTKVWKPDGGQERALDAFADVALRATFTHDSGRIVAGDWSGVIKVWNATDGVKLGELSSNPITPEEKMAAMSKQVDELTTASRAAATELANNQAILDKAAKELTTARQGKGAQVVEQTQAQLANARANAQNAGQALARAKENAAAKQNEANRLATVQTQAMLARDNAPTSQRKQARDQYEAAVKAATAATAMAKPAQNAIAGVQANFDKATIAATAAGETAQKALTTADTAAQQLPSKAAATSASADALAKSKLANDMATSKLNVATAEMNRLKAVLAARANPSKVTQDAAPTTKPASAEKSRT